MTSLPTPSDPLPATAALRREWSVTSGRYTRILQIIGRLPIAPAQSSSEVLIRARDLAIDWLARKKRLPLTAEATAGGSWDYEDDRSSLAAMIESSPGLWAVRLEDPCSEVSGRQWRVELAIAEAGPDEGPALGCTLSVLVPPGVQSTIDPTVPALVRDIARSIGIFDDGRRLDGLVWAVERPAEVDTLLSLLENQERTRAVVIISLPNHGQTFIDSHRLASELAGLAHVVTIGPDVAQTLSQRYGRSLAVFGNAIRLYRTNFDPDIDSFTRHPLFTSDRWSDRANSLHWAIRFDAVQETVARPDEARDMPSFSVIRRVAANRRLQEALKRPAGSEVNVDEIKRDLENLRDDAQSWQSLAFEEERKRKDAEIALAEARSRLWQYNARIQVLEHEREQAGIVDLAPTDWPDSFDELSDWCQRYLIGKVVVTGQAVRAARRSAFLEPALAYRALYHLATDYWSMRVDGGSEQQEKCKSAESALGLSRSPVGAALRNHRLEDQYRTTYEGRVYELDQHLAGADSRNQQYCLRVYFAWDPEDQLVIVGHLPTHLDNSLT